MGGAGRKMNPRGGVKRILCSGANPTIPDAPFFPMLRVLLLLSALSLLTLGLLTVRPAPPWSPWKLAVLAGEFGHWLAAVATVLGVAVWLLRSGGAAWAGPTAGVCAVAAVLLAKPCWQARRIAAELPAEFARVWGGAAGLPMRAPFAVAGLFGGDPEPVAVETHTTAAGLPVDFYRAVRSDRTPAPCVIVIHGGGWDSGDRAQLPALNHWLARRGYAVAAISYRLAPQFRWPAPRDDVRAAAAWLRANAGALGVDATRLVYLGRSAGGQIAQATAYDGAEPGLRGVIALYAPSDLVFGYVNTHENDMLKSPALMRQYLGGTPDSARANYESASALNHVGPRTPPTLLVHGTLDALCWYRHSERLAARLAEAKVPHVFVHLPWATHAFDFNLHGPGGQLTTYAVEAFLAAVTR